MANEKRCAIYNRYSVNAPQILDKKRDELISYCENDLGIPNHELFEEVGSVLEEREVFDQMMARIEQNEFSDVLVCHIDRIYKPGYDPEKLAEYVDRIRAKAVIHTVE
ncbi:MAG: recombinase family protein [Clostridia bacterium]|nr:recombinase family protein [Clostridia bacterium]